MKPLYHLLPCIMMAILCMQLHAQVDASVYPSKPVFDSLRYEKVDENSRPATLSCKEGGYGLYQLNVSETFDTEMENKYDTIVMKDGKWKLEDIFEFEKKYTEAHQKELKELGKHDAVDYPDVRKIFEERIPNLFEENWNTNDYWICDPNCKLEMEKCFYTWKILWIGNYKKEYRYETTGNSKRVGEDESNQLELEIKTTLHHEATVYFQVNCFCQDNNVMAPIVPSDEGGEYASSTAPATAAMRTDITATGTGRTTGHIADLKVKNTEDTPINILPQTVYIPSDGQYQPYVAEIPGTTIPPKTTVVIPVTGYCADVHKPPVGAGDGMPPIDAWIATTPAPTPKPSGTDYPVVTNVVPPFTPQNIPEIVTTPGFTLNPAPKTTPVPPGLIPTWPGTDIPVNGTIDPVEYPETFAPVIINALEKITVAFDKLKGEGTINTPFSGDPVKERESAIQQTLWIFTADITGEKYQKESFQEKVIDQFENSSGTTVATLPEPEKKKLDGGVDAFWNVFMLTGTEAKVLSINGMSNASNKPELISDYAKIAPIIDQIDEVEQQKNDLNNCFFTTMLYNVKIVHAYDRGAGKKKEHKKDEHVGNDKNEVTLNLKKDDTLNVNLINLNCICLCYNAIEKGGRKTGSSCTCTITGVSLTKYDMKNLKDIIKEDFTEPAKAELEDEVKAKMKKLNEDKEKATKTADIREIDAEIKKLEKQLKDGKIILSKDNMARFNELKSKLEGQWRLKRVKNDQTSFVVPKGITGKLEFDFIVQGECEGEGNCKGSEFSRAVKVTVIVK